MTDLSGWITIVTNVSLLVVVFFAACFVTDLLIEIFGNVSSKGYYED